MAALLKLHRLLLKTEQWLLVLLLLAMILIAVMQILLRNFWGGGLLWADGFTRSSVLWLAMLGAMLASRQQHHIAIDLLVQRLPARLQNIAIRLNRLVTAGICWAVAWFSLKLVLQEYGYGDMAFGHIPNWACQSIMPLAFGVIGLRYALAAFLPAARNMSP